MFVCDPADLSNHEWGGDPLEGRHPITYVVGVQFLPRPAGMRKYTDRFFFVDARSHDEAALLVHEQAIENMHVRNANAAAHAASMGQAPRWALTGYQVSSVKIKLDSLFDLMRADSDRKPFHWLNPDNVSRPAVMAMARYLQSFDDGEG